MIRKAAFRRTQSYALQWVLGIFLAVMIYGSSQDSTQPLNRWILLCLTLLVTMSLIKEYAGTARTLHYHTGKGFGYYRMTDWQIAMRHWLIVVLWAVILVLILFSPWASLIPIGFVSAILLGVVLYQRFRAAGEQHRKQLDQQLVEVLKQRKILNDDEDVVAIYGNLNVSSIITGTAASGISDLQMFTEQTAVFIVITDRECIIGSQRPAQLLVYTSIPLSRIHQLAVLSGGTSFRKSTRTDHTKGMIIVIGDEQAHQCNILFPLSVPSTIQRFVRCLLNQLDAAKSSGDRRDQPVARRHGGYVPFDRAMEVSTLETYAPFER